MDGRRHAEGTRRDVRRLDPQIRRRVADALDELLIDDPRGGKLRKLTGVDAFRLRVGDWRLIVELPFAQSTATS